MTPNDFWLERQVTWQDVLSNVILALAVCGGLLVVSLVAQGSPMLS